MRRAVVALLASSLVIGMSAAPAGAQTTNTQIFSLICASSIGFSGLDRETCEQLPGSEPPDSEQRKNGEALLANALAGNTFVALAIQNGLTEGTPVPFVPLQVDPCDAFLSTGGGCSTTPGAPPLAPYSNGSANSLNEVLTDEQEALLGCGPRYGTDCERDGIDLTNAETSVLLQSFPPVTEPVAIVPGARGPSDPGYDPNVDGSVPPPVPAFTSEMAALSWNFLMTLVAYSTAPAGTEPANDQLDPLDPTRTGTGQCSFAQPQPCRSVVAFLAPEPGATLATAAALATLTRLRARSRGCSGSPAPVG